MDNEEFVGLTGNKSFDDSEAGLYVLTDKKTGTGSNESKANNDKFNAVHFYGNKDYNVSIATKLADDVDADASSVKLGGTVKTYNNNGSTATTTKDKLYLNDKTSIVAAEDVKGDIAVKTATGSMKMSEKDPSYVAVIFKNDGNKAAYVVYAGAGIRAVRSAPRMLSIWWAIRTSISTPRKTPPTPSCGSWTA